MALAPLLYNITFDSQTRILYFWDKAGHEIYHCEIPSHAPSIPFGGVLTSTSDSVIRVPVEQAGGVLYEYSPAPALPTVTSEYLYPSTSYGKIINVSSGSTCNAWRMSSGFVYSGVTYDDTTKKQCIFGWRYYESSTWYAFYGGIETLNDQGTVGAKNTTSGTIKVFEWRYAECDSPDATVITVYDSSNNPYNAFKYTSDGTDYYYVLDGTQTDWTDDLGSIGYHILSVAYLGIQDTFVNWNVWVWLFENNSASQNISFDPNKRYIFDSAYTVNGNKVNLTSHTITIGRPNSTYEILGLIDSYSGFTAYKVYYHAIPNS